MRPLTTIVLVACVAGSVMGANAILRHVKQERQDAARASRFAATAGPAGVALERIRPGSEMAEVDAPPWLRAKVDALPSDVKVAHDLLALEVAVLLFRRDWGREPDTLDALSGYIQGGGIVPTDPWGRDYLYAPPLRTGGECVLYTLGRDGKPGGHGEDADIHLRDAKAKAMQGI